MLILFLEFVHFFFFSKAGRPKWVGLFHCLSVHYIEKSANLSLQVKVWFQNRRTKYKRVEAEEEGLPVPDDIEVDDEPDSEPEDNWFY